MGKAHHLKPGKWKNTKGPSCRPSEVSAVKIEVEEFCLDGVVSEDPADYTPLQPHDPHAILCDQLHPRILAPSPRSQLH